jgi:hypothetical protein
MLNYSLLFFIYIILVIWLGLINIVITEKIIQNPSHLLYKQRINYEKLLLLIKRKFEKKVLISNLPNIKDRHTEKPNAVLQHSGTITMKRLSARLSFCVKLATSLHHQYLVWVSAWSWQPLCTISISYCSILCLGLRLSKIMC